MSTTFQPQHLLIGMNTCQTIEIDENLVLFSYRSSPYDLHNAFAPIRWYYHVMRWMYGKGYDPFASAKTEGLHPLLVSMKYHQNKIHRVYFGAMYTIPTLIITVMLHKIQKIFIKRFYPSMKG